MDKTYYVYIMTNKSNEVLYTGITDDLVRRVYEHKKTLNKKSFTSRYNINKLVYYEIISSVYSAIEREKKIKSGSRMKKIELINSFIPEWENLSLSFE